MLVITQLNIYPIKSLSGISLQAATVTNTGFQYDRQWMLVDENNRFLTQREHPEMALLIPEFTADGFVISHKEKQLEKISIPFMPVDTKKETVQIWDDECEAIIAAEEINNWFSNALFMNCKLAYMPEDVKRKVDERYAGETDITTFTDGYPFLLIGESSLSELNTRLVEPLPMNRFRPNIVFSGGDAYAEDTFEEFTINGITFFGVKLSARCVVTTINQENAKKSKEPLKTLAAYRAKNNKIYFGQNLLHQGNGVLKVGDHLEIKKIKSGLFA